MPHIAGSHHATLSVAGAQEDVDFHTGTLGMRFIKKTVLYDGSLPIYHLYYSNAGGDASSVVTTFPFAQAGVTGRRGTNQARELHLSVPASSLDWWHRAAHRARGRRAGRRGARPAPAAAAPPLRHRVRARRGGGRPAPGLRRRRGARGARRPRDPRRRRARHAPGQHGRVRQRPVLRQGPGRGGRPRRHEDRRGAPRRLRRGGRQPQRRPGHLDVRQRHRAPLRLGHGELRQPGRGEVRDRGRRLHRHLRAQGPHLLQVGVRPDAVGRAVRAGGDDAAWAGRPTSRRTSWARPSRCRRSSPTQRDDILAQLEPIRL